MNKRFFILGLLSLALAGCGAQSVNTDEGTDLSARVVVTDHADRTHSFDDPPQRIVSLVQGDMEVAHQLGAEIVGRPTSSAQPVKALESAEQVGSAHEVDFEKVVSLRPDLIIGHADLNRKDVNTFESLGMNFFLTNGNRYEKIVEAIGFYGQILDREEEAEAMIADIERTKAEIESEPLSREVKALIVYGTTESLLAALPSSLSGDLLDIAGGKNIASDLPGIEHYPDYAQLSMERVVSANPDVVYFITHGDPTAVKDKFVQELQSNPAWSGVKAFENDQFVFLPFELFGTSPGPRVGEALQFLKDSLTQVAGKGA